MRPLRQLAQGLSAVMIAVALTACATAFGPANDRAYEVSAAWIDSRPAVAWYGGHQVHEAIFLRFADSRGRLNGPSLQLTDAARDAFEPSLQSIDQDILLAWYEQEPGVKGAAARQVALLARIDASGRRIWQRQLSAEDSRGRIPVVRVAGSAVHVAWLEQHADESPRLRAATLDAHGTWLRPPHDLAVAGRDTWNLNAAVDPQGQLHVVFDADHGPDAKELRWVIDRQAGIEQQAVDEDGWRSVYPDIALEESHFAIAWVDARDGNDEVYLRCGELGEGGAPAAAPAANDTAARRVTHSDGESLGAYLAWQSGELELAWIEVRGRRRELWRQRFDRHCIPRGAAAQIPGWGEAGIPSLAASARGLALAWNAMRGDPATATSRVLLKVWPRPQP